MKRLLLVVMGLVITCPSFSQDVVPNLTAGSKALLFTFGGLGNLSANNYNGGIGAKYYLSESLALRGGVIFGTASAKMPANPAPGDAGIDGSQSASTIGLNGGVEFRLGSGRAIPYIGGGVGFSSTRTESKNVVTGAPPPPQVTIKNNEFGETINGVSYTAGTTMSLFALAGFEFFLWKEVSLGGEYRFGFSSTSFSDEETVTGPTTVNKKLGSATSIGVGSAGVLTLAVYFN